MAEFKNFKIAVQKQFKKMSTETVFVVDATKDEMWEMYLNSFPKGTNEIYKERAEYDCVACKQFIRRCGNMVTIKNNKLVSIWDIGVIETPYDVVAEAMSKLIKSKAIRDIYIANEKKQGIDKNNVMQDDGKVLTWEHFYIELPTALVNRTHKSIESIQGTHRDTKNVFKRSLDELTLDAGLTILELIDQGSLYRGEEHKRAITEFINLKKKYKKVKAKEKDNWCWLESANSHISRIRNSAIGTLLIDISEDLDLDQAVRKFEAVMAPTNYKRPKAIFTKRMIEDAQKKIEELGYNNSLARRFAVLEDVTVNNVLFLNREVVNKKANMDVFDELKEETTVNPKSFSKIEEVSIDKFIKKILPSSKKVELMVESRHQNNFMSLVAPENRDASSMLKWDNNFSWSYKGDITDSMKQNVKNAGGNVEGILRFSIQWNENNDNKNDFDAHCIEPSRNLISYPKAGSVQPSSGVLDVDIVSPGNKIAVENITWTDINKMREGRYKFLVHNFSHHGGTSGFRAEIEYDGQIYSYDYTKELKQSERILVAEIEFNKKTGIKFIKTLDSKASSREIWGIPTNKFVNVSSFMLSPNYWDEQKNIGNKHYFFFIEGCKREDLPRGFYNEFLNEKLTKHRKVFEALGSKMRVEESDNQLSGIGFSSTQRNSIVARVEGKIKRTIKINF